MVADVVLSWTVKLLTLRWVILATTVSGKTPSDCLSMVFNCIVVSERKSAKFKIR